MASLTTWVRIKNDINGNGRWACHYDCIANTMEEAITIAKRLGGKRYRGKGHGRYFVVFQSSASGGGLQALEADIEKVKQEGRGRETDGNH